MKEELLTSNVKGWLGTKVYYGFIQNSRLPQDLGYSVQQIFSINLALFEDHDIELFEIRERPITYSLKDLYWILAALDVFHGK